jgi:hypothetical protein
MPETPEIIVLRASARESYPTPGVIELVEPSPIEPGEVYEYRTHLCKSSGGHRFDPME